MAVQSVERAFSIVELLTKHPGGMPLNEVADQIGLHLSTVHRLLKTLQSIGVVEQDRKTRFYRVGPGLLSMASLMLQTTDITALAYPHVSDLQHETGETVHLAVLLQGEACDIIVRESTHSIRASGQAGMRMPLYCTAIGKVLLAHQDTNSREWLLKTSELRPYTSKTILSVHGLRSDLDRIVQQGFAENVEEYSYGMAAIAAPILNFRQEVIAAMGIALPITRYTDVNREELRRLLGNRAMALSRDLGYRPTAPQTANAADAGGQSRVKAGATNGN